MAGDGREAPGGLEPGGTFRYGRSVSRGKGINWEVGKSAVRPQWKSTSRPLFTTMLVMTGKQKQKVGGLTPWALDKV